MVSNSGYHTGCQGSFVERLEKNVGNKQDLTLHPGVFTERPQEVYLGCSGFILFGPGSLVKVAR